jgi:tryptophan 2,3-dioxygenase
MVGAFIMTVFYRNVAKSTPYDLYIQLDRLRAGWGPSARRPEEVVLVCGFQSIELLCHLVRVTLDDRRITSAPDRRVSRFVDVIELALRAIGRALAGTTLSPDATTPAPATRPSPGLAVLTRLSARDRAQILGTLAAEFDDLLFRIGVEAQVTGTDPPANSDRSVFDYAAHVAPESMARLARRAPFGPEDHLFCTVHQIVECWLRIAHEHVEKAEHLAASGYCPRAATAVHHAAAAVHVATQAARLLDTMVLADYHPLRVRLRDGSGAQSQAAQNLPAASRRLMACLQRNLGASRATLLDVLDSPAVYPGLHALQAAIQDFARRCQAFLFEHYLLANTVLGMDNLGSLGFVIRVLGERALRPLLTDIDQAKHDLTILTNLRYGAHDGCIVMENELAVQPGLYHHPPPAGTSPAAAVIDDRVRQYFARIQARDAKGWTDLFAPGALFRSAAGRPYRGRPHIKIFIDTLFAEFSAVRVRLSAIRIEGNRAQVNWCFDAVVLGVPVTFNGSHWFEFDGDAAIHEAQMIWESADVAGQLQHAMVPPQGPLPDTERMTPSVALSLERSC